MKMYEAAARLRKLLQAQSVLDYSHRPPPISTYKHQTIGTRVCFGVLSDVPIWHPRAHDANRKQSLRNPNDREHIWMRIEPALFDHAMVCLV